MVSPRSREGNSKTKRQEKQVRQHGNDFLDAGPPELAETRSNSLYLENSEQAEAAFLGRQGAALLSVDVEDGRQLSEYELEAPPVFDGMIASRGRVFVALENGSLVCFGG